MADRAGSAPRTVFRQRAALGIGIGFIVLIVALLVVFAFGGGLDLGVTSWLLAAAVLLWLLFVRPCVRLTQDGVHLDNLARVTTLSWPAIDLIETRWNLTLVTPEGKGYAAWAVSAQRPRSERRGGRFGMLAGSPMPASPADLRNRPASAGDVQQAIQHGQDGYERALAAKLIQPQTAQVRRTWAPIALVGWAVFVVLVVVGFVS